MRIIFIVLFIFTMAVQSYSQLLPGDIKSRGSNPRNKSDGLAGKLYGGLVLKTVENFDNWGLDLGVSFGGMVSDKFSLGGGIYTLFTQNVRIIPDQPYFLRLNYGGVEPKFVFKFGDIAIHTKLFFGLGFAGYSESVNFDILSDLDGDWILIGEPSLGISYVINESMWLTLDGGWRVTGGVDFKRISANDLNGPMISLTLKTFIN